MKNRTKFLEDVSSQIAEMKRLERRFTEYLAQSETPPNTPGTVEVDSSGKVIVKCFDRTITAHPRLVINDKEEVYIEYNFDIIHNGAPISIWCFYLQHDGLLRPRPSPEGPCGICDFDNAHIRGLIVAEVAMGVLKSPVFAPANKRDRFVISGLKRNGI